MIYFIQAEIIGRIKIGYSSRSRLEKRIKQIGTSSPLELKLLATTNGKRQTERRIHDRFRSIRVKGEWFEPAPELIRFIFRIIRKTPGSMVPKISSLPPICEDPKPRVKRKPCQGQFQTVVFSFLVSLQGKSVSTAEVSRSLGKKVESVRTTLHRLHAAGLIRRIGSLWTSTVSIEES